MTPIPESSMKNAAIRCFEEKCCNIRHYFCDCCRKVTLEPGKGNVCTRCSGFKDSNHLLKSNALPVWYNKLGEVQYKVPDCLQRLTIAEKMLIQLASPFVPLRHIKNGIMGISGHVCTFEQDLDEFVRTLPRKETDSCLISVIRIVNNEIGSNETREEMFTVRRKEVLDALCWLKEHNPLYKNIPIDQRNLDWIEGEKGTLNHLLVQTDFGISTTDEQLQDINNDLGPCPAYAKESFAATGLKTLGTMDTSRAKSCNKDDLQIQDELINEISGSKSKERITLEFPKKAMKPINEYSDAKVFAMAYPWLFPGGLGDIKEWPEDPKAWGKFIYQYEDGRFCKDPFFCFFALNYITRNRNASSSNWFINNFNSGGPTTLDDLKKSIADGNSKFVNRLIYYSKRIKGSNSYWFQKKHELYTWINHHVEAGNGAPTFFITLSCAEYQWPDVIRLIKERMEMAGEDSSMCFVGSPKLSKYLNEYSIVVQEYFQKRVLFWLETVGKIVFDITKYWVRYEFAPGRGQIHAHLLAITKDKSIQQLCYSDLKEKNGAALRDKRLSDWASKRFGLTATVDNQFDDRLKDNRKSPCSIRFKDVSSIDIENDFMDLMKACQVHECSGFCMRSKCKKR